MLNSASNRFNAKDLWQKDHDHFLHPWTHFDSFKKDGSLLIVEGEGTHITDVNGKRYLDGLGGMWCVNVGYGRKEMAEAMAEQALLLPYANAFVDMSNAPAAELAAKLAELAPGSLNHVAFSTSGSCCKRHGDQARPFLSCAARRTLAASTSSRGTIPTMVRLI